MHYYTVELVVHLYSEICLWHCAHDLVLFEKVFAVPPCSVKDLIKFQSQLFFPFRQVLQDVISPAAATVAA